MDGPLRDVSIGFNHSKYIRNIYTVDLIQTLEQLEAYRNKLEKSFCIWPMEGTMQLRTVAKTHPLL